MLNLKSKASKFLPGNFIKKIFDSKKVQKILILFFTVSAAFFIVLNGATPIKYDLKLGDTSPYDITAPRDIENTLKTEEKARQAAAAVPPVIERHDNVPVKVISNADDYFTNIEELRTGILKNLQAMGIQKDTEEYDAALSQEYEYAVEQLYKTSSNYGVNISREQAEFLIVELEDKQLTEFRKSFRDLLSSAMMDNITQDNLDAKIRYVQQQLQMQDISDELKSVGDLLAARLIMPNSSINEELTRLQREEVYNREIQIPVIIEKGSRILSVGDIVTADKLDVLGRLNYLDTKKFDYTFAAGLLACIVLLAVLLVIYMRHFNRNIFGSVNNLLLLSIIIIITLLIARFVAPFSSLLIPIFTAAMLISILLDLRLAIACNIILTLAVSFFIEDSTVFIFMAIITGSLAAFITEKTTQRSALSATGLLISAINGAIILFMGLIYKNEPKTIAIDCLKGMANGIVSTILTIGILPFFESAFNIITPLKLLELANPNQPLMKRILMEAPGTYHHSLMVGNLAEAAAEAIGGNALLARVGAYYHDVGKIKRPNFFGENLIASNPHDRMNPNLSTLVIISHTQDGIEIARKHKIPLAVRDIIEQHHGTTIVAYFYHKAKSLGKPETVKEENYRYPGPKPKTREAAVVMLADSVEAAVRSLPEKTEGKIEGLVRKIIKDKLDDGQLDECDLTLKDLDEIAKAFMKVFSGYFHAREKYPDIRNLKDYEGLISLASMETIDNNKFSQNNMTQ